MKLYTTFKGAHAREEISPHLLFFVEVSQQKQSCAAVLAVGTQAALSQPREGVERQGEGELVGHSSKRPGALGGSGDHWVYFRPC